MATDEALESRHDRENAATKRLTSIVDSLKFTPPEHTAELLNQAHQMLNHHFAESIGRADVSFVVEILRKVEARKKSDPEFAEGLDEALKDKS